MDIVDVVVGVVTITLALSQHAVGSDLPDVRFVFVVQALAELQAIPKPEASNDAVGVEQRLIGLLVVLRSLGIKKDTGLWVSMRVSHRL